MDPETLIQSPEWQNGNADQRNQLKESAILQSAKDMKDGAELVSGFTKDGKQKDIEAFSMLGKKRVLNKWGQQELKRMDRYLTDAAGSEDGGVQTFSSGESYVRNPWAEVPKIGEVKNDFDVLQKMANSREDIGATSEITFEEWVDEVNSTRKDTATFLDKDNDKLKESFKKYQEASDFDIEGTFEGGEPTEMVNGQLLINPDRFGEISVVEDAIKKSDLPVAQKVATLERYRVAVEGAAFDVLSEERKSGEVLDLLRVATLGASTVLTGVRPNIKHVHEKALLAGHSSYEVLKANEENFKDMNAVSRAFVKTGYATIKATMQTGLAVDAMLASGVDKALGTDLATRVLEVSAEMEDRGASFNERYKGWDAGFITEDEATDLVGQIASFVAIGGVGSIGAAGLGKVGLQKAATQQAAQIGLREGFKTAGKGGLKKLVQQRGPQALMQGTVAGLQSGGMSMGSTYNHALAQGMSPEDAQHEAFMTGIGNGVATALVTSAFGFMTHAGMEKALLGSGGGESILDAAAAMGATMAGRKAIKQAATAMIQNKETRKILSKGLIKEYGRLTSSLGQTGLRTAAPILAEGVEETLDNALGEVLSVVLTGKGDFGDGIAQAWGNLGEHLHAGVLGLFGGGIGSTIGGSPGSTYSSVKKGYDQFVEGLERTAADPSNLVDVSLRDTAGAPVVSPDGSKKVVARPWTEVVSDPLVTNDEKVSAIVDAGMKTVQRVRGASESAPAAPAVASTEDTSIPASNAPIIIKPDVKNRYRFAQKRKAARNSDNQTIRDEQGEPINLPMAQLSKKDEEGNPVKVKGFPVFAGEKPLKNVNDWIMTKIFGGLPGSETYSVADTVKLDDTKGGFFKGKVKIGGKRVPVQVRMITADAQNVGVLIEKGDDHVIMTLDELRAQREADEGKANPMLPESVWNKKGMKDLLLLEGKNSSHFRGNDKGRKESKLAPDTEEQSDERAPSTESPASESGEGRGSVAPSGRELDEGGREDVGGTDTGEPTVQAKATPEVSEVPVETPSDTRQSSPQVTAEVEPTEAPAAEEPAPAELSEEEIKAQEEKAEALAATQAQEEQEQREAEEEQEAQNKADELAEGAETFLYVDRHSDDLRVGPKGFEFKVGTGEGATPIGVGTVMMTRDDRGLEGEELLIVKELEVRKTEDGSWETVAIGTLSDPKKTGKVHRQAEKSKVEVLVPALLDFINGDQLLTQEKAESLVDMIYKAFFPESSPGFNTEDAEIQIVDDLAGTEAFNLLFRPAQTSAEGKGKTIVTINRMALNQLMRKEVEGLEANDDETNSMVALGLGRLLARKFDEELRHVAAARSMTRDQRVQLAKDAYKHEGLKKVIDRIMLAQGFTTFAGNEDAIAFELLAMIGQAAYTGSTAGSELQAVRALAKAARTGKAGRFGHALVQTVKNYIARLHRAMQMRKLLRNLPDEIKDQVERMELFYNDMTQGTHDFDDIQKRLLDDTKDRVDLANDLLFGDEGIVPTTFFDLHKSAMKLRNLIRDLQIPYRAAIAIDPEKEEIRITKALRDYMMSRGLQAELAEIDGYLSILNEEGAVRALSSLIVESRERLMVARENLRYDPSALFEQTETDDPRVQRNRHLRAFFSLVDPRKKVRDESNVDRLRKREAELEGMEQKAQETLEDARESVAAVTRLRYRSLISKDATKTPEEMRERFRLEQAIFDQPSFNPEGELLSNIPTEAFQLWLDANENATSVAGIGAGLLTGEAMESLEDATLDLAKITQTRANYEWAKKAGTAIWEKPEDKVAEPSSVEALTPEQTYRQALEDRRAEMKLNPEFQDGKFQQYEDFREALDEYNNLIKWWPQRLLNLTSNDKRGFGEHFNETLGDPSNPEGKTMFGYNYYTGQAVSQNSRNQNRLDESGNPIGQELNKVRAYGHLNKALPRDANLAEKKAVEKRARAIQSNAASLGRMEFESRRETAFLFGSELSNPVEFFLTGGFAADVTEDNEIVSPLDYLKKYEGIEELQNFSKDPLDPQWDQLRKEMNEQTRKIMDWVSSLNPDLPISERLDLDGKPTLAGQWDKLSSKRVGKVLAVMPDETPTDGVLDLVSYINAQLRQLDAIDDVQKRHDGTEKLMDHAMKYLVHNVTALHHEVGLVRRSLEEFTSSENYSNMMREVRLQHQIGNEARFSEFGMDAKDPAFVNLVYDIPTLMRMDWDYEFIHSDIGSGTSLAPVHAVQLQQKWGKLRTSGEGALPVVDRKEMRGNEGLEVGSGQVNTIEEIREVEGTPRTMQTADVGSDRNTTPLGGRSTAEALEREAAATRILVSQSAFILFDGDMGAVASFFRKPMGTPDLRRPDELVEGYGKDGARLDLSEAAASLRERGLTFDVDFVAMMNTPGMTHETFLHDAIEVIAQQEQEVIDKARRNAQDAAQVVGDDLESLTAIATADIIESRVRARVRAKGRGLVVTERVKEEAKKEAIAQTEQANLIGQAMKLESDPAIFFANQTARTGDESVLDLLSTSPLVSAITQMVPDLLIYYPSPKNPLSREIPSSVQIVEGTEGAVMVVPTSENGVRTDLLTKVLTYAAKSNPQAQAAIEKVAQEMFAKIRRAKLLAYSNETELMKRFEASFDKLQPKVRQALSDKVKRALAFRLQEKTARMFRAFDNGDKMAAINPRTYDSLFGDAMKDIDVTGTLSAELVSEFVAETLTNPDIVNTLEIFELDEIDTLNPMFSPDMAVEVLKRVGSTLQAGKTDVSYDVLTESVEKEVGEVAEFQENLGQTGEPTSFGDQLQRVIDGSPLADQLGESPLTDDRIIELIDEMPIEDVASFIRSYEMQNAWEEGEIWKGAIQPTNEQLQVLRDTVGSSKAHVFVANAAMELMSAIRSTNEMNVQDAFAYDDTAEKSGGPGRLTDEQILNRSMVISPLFKDNGGRRRGSWLDYHGDYSPLTLAFRTNRRRRITSQLLGQTPTLSAVLNNIQLGEDWHKQERGRANVFLSDPESFFKNTVIWSNPIEEIAAFLPEDVIEQAKHMASEEYRGLNYSLDEVAKEISNVWKRIGAVRNEESKVTAADIEDPAVLRRTVVRTLAMDMASNTLDAARRAPQLERVLQEAFEKEGGRGLDMIAKGVGMHDRLVSELEAAQAEMENYEEFTQSLDAEYMESLVENRDALLRKISSFREAIARERVVMQSNVEETLASYLEHRMNPNDAAKILAQFPGLRLPTLPPLTDQGGRPAKLNPWNKRFKRATTAVGLASQYEAAFDKQALDKISEALTPVKDVHDIGKGLPVDVKKAMASIMRESRKALPENPTYADIKQGVEEAMENLGVTPESMAEGVFLTPSEQKSLFEATRDGRRKALEQELEGLMERQDDLKREVSMWERGTYENDFKLVIPVPAELQEERKVALKTDRLGGDPAYLPMEIIMRAEDLKNPSERDIRQHVAEVVEIRAVKDALTQFVNLRGEAIYKAVRGESGYFKQMDADVLIEETVARATLESMAEKERRSEMKKWLSKSEDVNGVSPGMIGMLTSEGGMRAVVRDKDGNLKKFKHGKGKSPVDLAADASVVLKGSDGPVVFFPENARTLLKNHQKALKGTGSIEEAMRDLILNSADPSSDMNLGDLYGATSLDPEHLEKNEEAAYEAGQKVAAAVEKVASRWDKQTQDKKGKPLAKEFGQQGKKMAALYSKLVYNIMLFSGHDLIIKEGVPATPTSPARHSTQRRIDDLKVKLAAFDWENPTLSALADLDVLDIYSRAFTDVAGAKLLENISAGIVKLGPVETNILRREAHRDGRVRREFGKDFTAYLEALRMLSLSEVGLDGNTGRFAFKAEYEASRKHLAEFVSRDKMGKDWEVGARAYVLASLQGLEAAAEHNGESSYKQALDWWEGLSEGMADLSNLAVNTPRQKGRAKTYFLEGNSSIIEGRNATKEIVDLLRPIFSTLADFKNPTDGGLWTKDQAFTLMMEQAEEALLKGQPAGRKTAMKGYAAKLNQVFAGVHQGYHLASSLTMGPELAKDGRPLKLQSVVPIRFGVASNPLFTEIKEEDKEVSPENSVKLDQGSILGHSNYGSAFNLEVSERAMTTLRPVDLNGMGAVDAMLRDAFYRMNVAPGYLVLRKSFGKEDLKPDNTHQLSTDGQIFSIVKALPIEERTRAKLALKAIVRESELQIVNDNARGAEDSRVSKIYQGLGAWWVFRRLFSVLQPWLQTAPAFVGYGIKKISVGKYSSIRNFDEALVLSGIGAIGNSPLNKLPGIGPALKKFSKKGRDLNDFVRRTNIYVSHRGMDGQDRYRQTSRAMNVHGNLFTKNLKRLAGSFPRYMEGAMDIIFGGPERWVARSIYVTEMLEELQARPGQGQRPPDTFEDMFRMKSIDTLATIRADIKTSDMMGMADQSKKSWWFQSTGSSPEMAQLKRAFSRMSNHTATTTSNMTALIPSLFGADRDMRREARENIVGTLVQNSLFHMVKPKVMIPLVIYIAARMKGMDDEEAKEEANRLASQVIKAMAPEDESRYEMSEQAIQNRFKSWIFGTGRHKFESHGNQSWDEAQLEGASDIAQRIGWEFGGSIPIVGHFAGYSFLGDASSGIRAWGMDQIMSAQYEAQTGRPIDINSHYDVTEKKFGEVEKWMGYTVPTQAAFDLGDIAYRTFGNAEEAGPLQTGVYLMHEFLATREARSAQQKAMEKAGGVNRYQRNRR